MNETYPMAVVSEPGKIEFIERKMPVLNAYDVLIKVRAAAICGSDLHVFKGAHPAVSLPVAIGHELSGEVIKVGENVTKVEPGDRVTVEPIIVCGECYFCRRGQYHLCLEISFQYRQGQGGFATHFVSHENWVHVLPENLSYEEGALMEPLSVSAHACKKSGLEIGQCTAIFGDGPIGLLILMLANLAGVEKIFLAGARTFRLEKGLQLGAYKAINNYDEDAVSLILDRTSRLGVDRSFEAVGIETTLVQSLKVLKKGGIATLVGLFEQSEINIPANLFVQREITLTGSQGYNWDFQTALVLASQGRVNLNDLITHVMPMTSLEKGFDLMMDSESEAIKVILTNE
jgi:2-desacetyl-2-hydroxyethyl bacteriochlorophyllide A dehydrogenase